MFYSITYFRYTGTEFEGLGIFVESFNGVFGDVANEISWAFLRRVSDTDLCTLSLGKNELSIKKDSVICIFFKIKVTSIIKNLFSNL